MAEKLDFKKSVLIKNKKASFNYEFLDTFDCGMVLQGTEIKSIRLQKVNLTDAFCFISGGEMYVKNLHISPYELGTHYNHAPMRERKLLLKKKEIQKLEEKLKDQGLTLVPTKLFITDRGFAKIQIALAKGKKLHDKRESLKEKDSKRDLERGI